MDFIIINRNKYKFQFFIHLIVTILIYLFQKLITDYVFITTTPNYNKWTNPINLPSFPPRKISAPFKMPKRPFRTPKDSLSASPPSNTKWKSHFLVNQKKNASWGNPQVLMALKVFTNWSQKREKRMRKTSQKLNIFDRMWLVLTLNTSVPSTSSLKVSMSTTLLPIGLIDPSKTWLSTQKHLLPILILNSVIMEVRHFQNLEYSTEMMHYSQKSLLKSFSADPDLYVALPTGSGSTGAI